MYDVMCGGLRGAQDSTDLIGREGGSSLGGRPPLPDDALSRTSCGVKDALHLRGGAVVALRTGAAESGLLRAKEAPHREDVPALQHVNLGGFGRDAEQHSLCNAVIHGDFPHDTSLMGYSGEESCPSRTFTAARAAFASNFDRGEPSWKKKMMRDWDIFWAISASLFATF